MLPLHAQPTLYLLLHNSRRNHSVRFWQPVYEIKLKVDAYLKYRKGPRFLTESDKSFIKDWSDDIRNIYITYFKLVTLKKLDAFVDIPPPFDSGLGFGVTISSILQIQLITDCVYPYLLERQCNGHRRIAAKLNWPCCVFQTGE